MSRQVLISAHRFAFWTTLLQLLSRPRVVEQYLDVPLAEAIPRSRWASSWATTLVGITLFLRYHASVVHLVTSRIGWRQQVSWFYSAFILLVCLVLAAVIGYGFLRLYTLVTHVLTINVFKTRGQRLRLLNAESTLLSLSAPFAGSYIVSLLVPTLGWTLMALVCLYGMILLAQSYNTIFHKQRLGGFRLLLSATVVTWFVLSIGALAIVVTFAVVAFFALAILRLFIRH